MLDSRGTLSRITQPQGVALLIFTVPCVAISLFIPIGSGFQFGTDEGYEVMKAFLVYQGWGLYDPIWSDQPPLFTLLLAGSFKVFGPSILTARAVVVCFTGLLLASLAWLLARDRGPLTAMLGVATLALFPSFLKLGVSVMQVVPMLALGMLATALFRFALGSGQDRRFVASGLVLGLGFTLKLTIALFLPALLIEWLAAYRKTPPDRRGRAWREGAVFALAAGGTFFFITLGFTPSIQPDMLLGTHFSEKTYTASSATPPTELVFRLFEANPSLTAITVASMLLLLLRRVRAARIPIVLLATVFFAHTVHRPYWPYYDLHFALPMAWITALAVHELARLTLNAEWRLWPLPWRGLASYLAFAGALGILLTEMAYQWQVSVAPLAHQSRERNRALVQAMAQYRDEVELVFTHDALTAFHARVPVIPELAVLSNKRQRAGRSSDAQIASLIQKRQPKLIHLRPRTIASLNIRDWLEAHYRKHTNASNLYLHKSLR